MTLKNFKRDNSGNAAVEFGLVYPIFILIIFSLIEFGIIMFVRSAVTDAVIEASRFGITGYNYEELQDLKGDDVPLDPEEFIIYKVTEKLSFIPNGGDLIVSTIPLGKIDSIDRNGNRTGVGSGDEVIMYKVDYTWNVISPIVMLMMGTQDMVISARTVVKNEDY